MKNRVIPPLKYTSKFKVKIINTVNNAEKYFRVKTNAVFDSVKLKLQKWFLLFYFINY